MGPLQATVIAHLAPREPSRPHGTNSLVVRGHLATRVLMCLSLAPASATAYASAVASTTTVIRQHRMQVLARLIDLVPRARTSRSEGIPLTTESVRHALPEPLPLVPTEPFAHHGNPARLESISRSRAHPRPTACAHLVQAPLSRPRKTQSHVHPRRCVLLDASSLPSAPPQPTAFVRTAPPPRSQVRITLPPALPGTIALWASTTPRTRPLVLIAAVQLVFQGPFPQP
jgi:hypothetical protein